MKKDNLNEHDLTKRMLAVIKNQLVFESDMGNSDFESNMETLEKEYFEKDKESFLGKVDNGATFTNYEINKENKNIIFSGILDSGIEWSYSKNDGVQIGTPVGNKFVSFTANDLKILNVLINYYDLWKSDWQDNFNTDTMLKD